MSFVDLMMIQQTMLLKSLMMLRGWHLELFSLSMMSVFSNTAAFNAHHQIIYLGATGRTDIPKKSEKIVTAF